MTVRIFPALIGWWVEHTVPIPCDVPRVVSAQTVTLHWRPTRAWASNLAHRLVGS